MHSQFNLWKATIAVVIYVALCMLILCFSPPDDAQTMRVIPCRWSTDQPSDTSGS
ncbi:MAG: hypothetical protein ABSF50_03600 [Burkholderiaceae bacterium]|jgi:hypothetical protein